MAGYADTRQMIINTLMGRPAGTEIQPEEHQAFALMITDYIRQVELVSGNSVPIGYADEDTVPIQPDNGQAVYISDVEEGETKTFVNFIGQDGNAISITSSDDKATLVTLIWNAQYWSANSIEIPVVQGPVGPQGPQGPQGLQGNDGITPHIDETTGNWFIGTVDTGIHAQGPQGSSVEVINDLITDDASKALSSAMGKFLKEEVDKKAEIKVENATLVITGGEIIEGEISEYAQNGLVFLLDGKEKGNVSGKWEDVIGSILFDNNGAVFNSDNVQTSEGYLSYSGDNIVGAAQGTSTIELVIETSSYTSAAKFVFSPNKNGNIQAVVNNQGFTIYTTSTGKRYAAARSSGKQTISLSSALGYQNGIPLAQNATDYFGAQTNAAYIGRRDSTTDLFNGKIYSIRIYNRILSKNEILHNAKVDNVRFSLGLDL